MVGRPQPYLKEALSWSIRAKILNLRLHTILTPTFNPTCFNVPMGKTLYCRICNGFIESWSHFLCLCPGLRHERKRLLKQTFLRYGIRTCIEAGSLCFRSDLKTCELAKFAKFGDLVQARLGWPRKDLFPQ